MDIRETRRDSPTYLIMYNHSSLPSSPLDEVCRRDPKLAEIRDRLGDPLPWTRPATFATLVRIICEQQVSLASGKATFDRLRSRCDGAINATRIGRFNESQLKQCGLSRQKARYISKLADDIVDRRFSVSNLSRLDDDAARQSITSRLGLGNWTADIYLMMALRRNDILPVGDLGLVKGLEELDEVTYSGGKTTAADVVQRAEIWRPFRSWGTKLVWSLYLANRSRTTL